MVFLSLSSGFASHEPNYPIAKVTIVPSSALIRPGMTLAEVNQLLQEEPSGGIMAGFARGGAGVYFYDRSGLVIHCGAGPRVSCIKRVRPWVPQRRQQGQLKK